MADGFHPLRLGTIMMFGSLEFMSLCSGYDVVLLPPRGDTEPCPEPTPPQPVRGRRSGHHGGGARRGRQRSRSLTLPPRQGPVRPSPHISLTRSPILLARQVLEEGPVEQQALPHGPTGGLRDLLFRPGQRAKHGSRLLFRRGTRGPRLLVTLHPRMEERQQRLPSSLLGSEAQPPLTPLPQALH